MSATGEIGVTVHAWRVTAQAAAESRFRRHIEPVSPRSLAASMRLACCQTAGVRRRNGMVKSFYFQAKPVSASPESPRYCENVLPEITPSGSVISARPITLTAPYIR